MDELKKEVLLEDLEPDLTYIPDDDEVDIEEGDVDD